MNRSDVALLVSQKAARFGDRNAQEFGFLMSSLAKIEEEELLYGLIQVFTHGAPPPEGSAAQELAGALLIGLNPEARLDLEKVLRESLSRYELSVEQFPQYFANNCGKEVVLGVLARLAAEDLSAAQRRAMETMRFWLRQVAANAE